MSEWEKDKRFADNVIRKLCKEAKFDGWFKSQCTSDVIFTYKTEKHEWWFKKHNRGWSVSRWTLGKGRFVWIATTDSEKASRCFFKTKTKGFGKDRYFQEAEYFVRPFKKSC